MRSADRRQQPLEACGVQILGPPPTRGARICGEGTQVMLSWRQEYLDPGGLPRNSEKNKPVSSTYCVPSMVPNA